MKTDNGVKAIALMFMIIFAAAVFLGTANDARAAYSVNDTESSTISVSVASITMIDLTPTSMNFGTANPGTTRNNYTSSGLTLDQFQVENIGSTNVTNIWFNVSQPTTNPFGTGDNSTYDAANFIFVNDTNGDWKPVDMLEYNHPTNIVYLTLPTNYQSQGRFHMGPDEYFWATSSTDSNCSGSAGTDLIYVGNGTAHNPSQTGSIDLSANYSSIASTSTSDWGVTNVTLGDKTYCAAVKSSCDQVRLYRWNADAPGAAGGACQFTGLYRPDALTPGDSYPVGIRMFVPYGTAVGTLKQGTLTVLATSP